MAAVKVTTVFRIHKLARKLPH